MEVYLCPQRVASPLVQVPHQHHNQFYIFDGDLLDQDTYDATIPNDSHDMIPNNLQVPMVPAITAAIGADPYLIGMGPYQIGDPDTEK